MSIILLCTIFLGNFTVTYAYKPNFDLHSEAVYMVNTDTDIVIASENANKKMYPASTTKIMTCLLALDHVKDFDSYAFIPYTAFNEFRDGLNPNFSGGVSNAAIEPKQSNITYRDLIYSLMVASACESANILAYNIGGESIENFVQMMNAKAKEIGCKNTHFSNPHGLYDDNNYTTAYDLYLITKYAIDNYPQFMEICDTLSYTLPANEWNPEPYTKYQTNQLIRPDSDYYYEGVHGVKTGSIDYYYHKKADGTFDYENVDPGSRALVTTAERDGFHYILVTLNAPYFNEDGTTDINYSFVDHANLYDWAFKTFEYTEVINKKEQITQISVDIGKSEKLGVKVTEDFWTLLPKGLDQSLFMRKVILDNDMLMAPVEKGTEVGKLEVYIDNKLFTTMTLVTESGTGIDMMELYTRKFKKTIEQPEFAAIIILIIALIIVCIVSGTIRKNYRRRVAEMNRRRKINMAPQRNARKNPNRRKY